MIIFHLLRLHFKHILLSERTSSKRLSLIAATFNALYLKIMN